uniref:Uncharacterized protein n=2 Tax=Ceratitis capitata TaxID=7213 RepID=W8BXU5_CERCA
MNHHRNLLRYELDLAPKHTEKQIHHHLNTRSTAMECTKNMTDHLESVQSQAQNSLKELRDKLAIFTRARFNDEPSETYKFWRNHSLNLTHPYTFCYERHYDSTARPEFKHLNYPKLTKELFEEELKKIYKTWKILEGVYYQTVNPTNINNWRDRSSEAFNNMLFYFNLTLTQLQNNRNNVGNLLGNTISHELDSNIPLVYNTTAQVREWLIILESISFLHYLTGLCTKLIEMCS